MFLNGLLVKTVELSPSNVINSIPFGGISHTDMHTRTKIQSVLPRLKSRPISANFGHFSQFWVISAEMNFVLFCRYMQHICILHFAAQSHKKRGRESNKLKFQNINLRRIWKVVYLYSGRGDGVSWGRWNQ